LKKISPSYNIAGYYFRYFSLVIFWTEFRASKSAI